MYGVTQLDICEDVALISLYKLPLDLSVIGGIFQEFANGQINIDMISQTAPLGDRVTIAFTCPDSEIIRVLEVSKRLSEQYPGIKPMVSSGNCKIRLYGTEMRTSHGVFARAVNALPKGVEPYQISTSEEDISILVSAAQLEQAASSLREAFLLP